MPISGTGWEMLIVRSRQDRRGSRIRTVGTYSVFHDGAAIPGLSGACAESKGPGDNSQAENGKRVEARRYPLLTQAGTKYVTIGYTANLNPAALPRPGIELGRTAPRTEILIHPGRGFLSSIGCINLTDALDASDTDMQFSESRSRVIAVIDDLKSYLGASFPSKNGKAIPRAFVIIEGEP